MLIVLAQSTITTLPKDKNLSNSFESAAKYAYLIDFESNDVLYEKNGHIPMTPSSMTKIMTSYIAFQCLQNKELKFSDKIIISSDAAKKGGSKMFLKPGQKVSMDEIIKGIIIVSGNDASVAIAEKISGSEENFVKKMNLEAQKLGLDNSVFKNSTGWPDDGHVMSAKDLATVTMQLIKKFPEYYHYHSIKTFSFNNIKQTNRNNLIGLYGIDGVKTGKTSSGGYGVVVSAKKNNRRLIAVVNGLLSEKEREEEARRLIEYGFSNFKNISLFQENKDVIESDVIHGNVSHVILSVQNEILITVPKDYDTMTDLTFVTEFKEPLRAPIKERETVGYLKIIDSRKETLIKKVDLIVNKTIDKGSYLKILWQRIRYFLISIGNRSPNK